MHSDEAQSAEGCFINVSSWEADYKTAHLKPHDVTTALMMQFIKQNSSEMCFSDRLRPLEAAVALRGAPQLCGGRADCSGLNTMTVVWWLAFHTPAIRCLPCFQWAVLGRLQQRAKDLQVLHAGFNMHLIYRSLLRTPALCTVTSEETGDF
ncbi:unnamed protein product [Boreogadus saida]